MTDETKNNDKPTPEVQDKLVTTHHTVTIGGREIRYTATTGTMVLKEESEKGGEAKNNNYTYTGRDYDRDSGLYY